MGNLKNLLREKMHTGDHSSSWKCMNNITNTTTLIRTRSLGCKSVVLLILIFISIQVFICFCIFVFVCKYPWIIIDILVSWVFMFYFMYIYIFNLFNLLDWIDRQILQLKYSTGKEKRFLHIFLQDFDTGIYF